MFTPQMFTKELFLLLFGNKDLFDVFPVSVPPKSNVSFFPYKYKFGHCMSAKKTAENMLIDQSNPFCIVFV